MLPVITMIALFVIGAGQVVGAVYMLAGPGWALLALGIATIAAGAVMARGMVS